MLNVKREAVNTVAAHYEADALTARRPKDNKYLGLVPVFLDIKKAYLTVNHEIVIKKQNIMAFRGIADKLLTS